MSAIVDWSVPLLVSAPILENFPDTKMIIHFRLSDYIELNSISVEQMLFGEAKAYLGV